MSLLILCIVGFLSRLPSIELSSGLVLFSTNAAMQLIVPSSSQESKILNNKWLEWEISQLQVKNNKLVMSVYVYNNIN